MRREPSAAVWRHGLGMAMNRRRLGQSDLFVSEIGLGCMSLGSDFAAAREIIARAVDAGVNFFDTADLYDHGRNEEIVGRALAGVRDRVVIASKVGNRWREDGSGWDWHPDPAYIRRAVEDSLRRLRIDVIDLYQLHGGTLGDPIDEIIATFEELQREGRIRYYGISSIRPNVIRQWLQRSRMVSVMMQYSLLDRRPEEEMLELLAEHNVSVIARGPVAKGLLAGKPPRDYLEHSAADVASVQRALAAFVRNDRTMAQTALRYVLAHPAVATAVPGASSVTQLLENVGAAAAPPLTADELAQLQAQAPALRYRQHR